MAPLLRLRWAGPTCGLLAVAMGALLLAPGCGNRHPPRTQAEIDLDNLLAAKVRENLTAAGPDVRATDITVTAFGLVVKLKGDVRSADERSRAIAIAQGTEVVRDGAPHKPKEVDAKELTVKTQ